MPGFNLLLMMFAVAAGGALGSVLRYSVSLIIPERVADGFPLATLTVNILGSFVMGILIGILMVRGGEHPLLRGFLAVGVLGGFTTFSTFSLDVMTLFERSDYILAGGYVIGSVVFSITALGIGLFLGRQIL